MAPVSSSGLSSCPPPITLTPQNARFRPVFRAVFQCLSGCASCSNGHRETTAMTFKVFTIAAALGLAASTASAQGTSWLGNAAAYSDDQYRAPYSDARRVAYDNGYRDGVKRGEQAARDGRQFDVER